MILQISHSDILQAPNADELLREYSRECSIAEIGETDPQREMYAAMEKTGLMQNYGAFEDRTMVGFASILNYILPHYGKKIATVESLFVLPEYRKYGHGTAMIRAIETFSSNQGCVAILYTAPAKSQLEKLLSLNKSYRQTNSIFCKKL